MSSPRLIRPQTLHNVGLDPRTLVTRQQRGELQRVRRGVYVDASEWAALSATQRYGLRALAYQQSAQSQPIFSHETAAMLWGLWLVGMPPALHVLTKHASGGRSKNGVVRHFGNTTDSIISCGTFRITDKISTVIALMTTLDFPYAVAVCDSSLRVCAPQYQFNLFTRTDNPYLDPTWQTNHPQGLSLRKDELLAAAAELPSQAARRRALAVINFSSGLSESAGESISRAMMHMYGFPAPTLQHRFVLRNGANAFADFYFEEFTLVGEFDGKGKYLKAEWARGASVADRVMAEKAREDQIRAQGVRVVRWDWAELMNRERFVATLRAAGLPQK